jgi:predicted nuclease of predicted toxin-antitoxin system
VRFYLDEDLSIRVAEIARRSGVDVSTTQEHGRNGAPDEDQLVHATELGRCIVTRNRRDFMRLARIYATEGRDHAGILLVPTSIENDDFVGLARAIVRYNREHPEDMPAGMLDYLRQSD